MFSERLSNGLNVLTNVGVIVGLTLVAYEIRQTNQGMERDYNAAMNETSANYTEAWFGFRSQIAGDAELADIWLRGNSVQELTAVEYERYVQLALTAINLHRMGYDSWATITGEEQEWAIQSFRVYLEDKPGLGAQAQAHYADGGGGDFGACARRLGQPELQE